MHNPCFNHRYGFCWWPTAEEDICSHCKTTEIDDNNTIHCVHDMEFPVLTVFQPYALMLVSGVKPFEFRNWKLPEQYVGKRIFIHSGRRDLYFNKNYCDEEIFFKYLHKAYYDELFEMIIGSVVFGESEGPIDGIMFGAPYKMYKWPVTDPIRLKEPLMNIRGKQRIWKIKF